MTTELFKDIKRRFPQEFQEPINLFDTVENLRHPSIGQLCAAFCASGEPACCFFIPLSPEQPEFDIRKYSALQLKPVRRMHSKFLTKSVGRAYPPPWENVVCPVETILTYPGAMVAGSELNVPAYLSRSQPLYYHDKFLGVPAWDNLASQILPPWLMPVGPYDLNYLSEKVDLQHIPGISVPWTYLGTAGTNFGVHFETNWAPAGHYLHDGGMKLWCCVSIQYAQQLADVLKEEIKDLLEEDEEYPALGILYLRDVLPLPHFLKEKGIPFKLVYQKPGSLIMTSPGTLHFGFNLADGDKKYVLGLAWNPFLHMYDDMYQCASSLDRHINLKIPSLSLFGLAVQRSELPVDLMCISYASVFVEGCQKKKPFDPIPFLFSKDRNCPSWMPRLESLAIQVHNGLLGAVKSEEIEVVHFADLVHLTAYGEIKTRVGGTAVRVGSKYELCRCVRCNTQCFVAFHICKTETDGQTVVACPRCIQVHNDLIPKKFVCVDQDELTALARSSQKFWLTKTASLDTNEKEALQCFRDRAVAGYRNQLEWGRSFITSEEISPMPNQSKTMPATDTFSS